MSLLDILFGCSHSRTSFPQTLTRRATYVCCLDCGAEFAYDLRRMRRGSRIERPILKPDAVAEARADSHEIATTPSEVAQ